MPELPEVETVVRQLRSQMLGWRIAHVWVARRDIIHGDPRPLGRILIGRRVVQLQRQAKRIVMDLEPKRTKASHPADREKHDPAQLVIHLGMSGRLRLQEKGEKRERHTHLRIGFDGTTRELRFRDPRRFGGVWCLTGNPGYRGKVLGSLGPEPLTLRVQRFQKILQRKRQIKALLLDQKTIAGLGNIYCDEALFDAHVHPEAIAMHLDAQRAGELLSSIKKTLRKAIKHKGSTLTDYRSADGKPGMFQKMHRIYGREGLPCRRCGKPITRRMVAGRSTFVCRICQPRG